jgi:hypothetical protein
VEIEIDISEVDEKVVDLIVLAVCLTMTDAKQINPTVAECVVAFQRLIEVVLSDHGETLH